MLLDFELSGVAFLFTGIIALCTCSLVILIALYYGVLLPQVHRMDDDMKRTRGTLLLFPSEVLAAVAEFLGQTSLRAE